MPNSTTNFSLNKPLVNNATDEDLWGGYLNDNWDDADEILGKEDFHFFIETVSDKTYVLMQKARHAGTITETTTDAGSGTCTATFKINGVALGGTANSVSTSEQSQAHASANTFSAGDTISVTVSSNSSCTDMAASVFYTRTSAGS